MRSKVGASIDRRIESYLEGGGSIGDLYGVEPGQLDVLYSFAHRRFVANEIEGARQLFLALATINSHRFDAWMGLGLCYQRQQSHAAALFCLSRAALLERLDPRPSLACAASLLCIGKRDNAEMAYETAIRCCGKQKEFLALREAATAGLNKMKQGDPNGE